MRWLLCLVVTLPAFAIRSDPASTAMVAKNATIAIGSHPAISCWDGISLDQFEVSCEWVINV